MLCGACFTYRGDWDAAEHQQSSEILPTGIPWRYIQYAALQYMYVYIQLLTQCIPSYISTVTVCTLYSGHTLALYHLAVMHADGKAVKRNCNYAVEVREREYVVI